MIEIVIYSTKFKKNDYRIVNIDNDCDHDPGVLWAVNTKSIHHMIPFTDVTLTRLQVAPHSEKAEGFKVITVDQYNNIWTG